MTTLIGNNEIQEAPDLLESIQCFRCGCIHKVETFIEEPSETAPLNPYKEEPIRYLSFYRCNGSQYLVGINGKDIRRPWRG